VHALLLAFAFLSRLPVPGWVHNFDEDTFRRSTVWYPLVGAVLGAILGGVALLGAQVWPFGVALLVAMALDLRLSGAFHEDGLADTFDALGGGWTRERRLEILKDSRLGTYGTLALGLGVFLRYSALAALPREAFLPALVASGAIGRLAGVALRAWLPPLADRPGLTGMLTQVGVRELRGGLLVCAPFVIWLRLGTSNLALALVIAAPLLVIAGARRSFARSIGGTTGDLLGATNYMGQLAVLLAVLAAV
jgi:adenosylcobinamide-GDP ribazoletransferase